MVFGRRERRLARGAQDRIADLGAYAEETVNAIRTVQAFTHEAVDRARFNDRVERSIGALTISRRLKIDHETLIHVSAATILFASIGRLLASVIM